MTLYDPIRPYTTLYDPIFPIVRQLKALPSTRNPDHFNMNELLLLLLLLFQRY